METSTIWWLFTGAFVALELATGTFYLLMLALGMTAGAVCAHLGLAGTTQLVVAALVGALAVLSWHRTHPMTSTKAAEQNQDVHLDIGSTVEVTQWQSPEATRVVHRGAQWSARLIQKGLPDGALPEIGFHRIVAVDGNTLVLSKI
jgi:membrane protein implicated in regulation of membrane protease activity